MTDIAPPSRNLRLIAKFFGHLLSANNEIALAYNLLKGKPSIDLLTKWSLFYKEGISEGIYEFSIYPVDGFDNIEVKFSAYNCVGGVVGRLPLPHQNIPFFYCDVPDNRKIEWENVKRFFETIDEWIMEIIK